MADAAPSVSYKISAGTLNNMKEAAGNYMPNYGNWRYRVEPPEPEIDNSDDDEFDEEALDVDPVDFTDEDSWGEEAKTGNDFADNCYEADGTRKEGHVYTSREGKQILCAWNEDHVSTGAHDYTTGDTRGGVKRKGQINRKTGLQENVVDEYYGAPPPSDYTVFKKTTPLKALGGVSSGSAFKSDLEVMEQQIDPYEELMSVASSYRGATSGHHDQIKQIVGEMKNNYNNGDKQVQAEQHVDMVKLARVNKEEVGDEGLASTIQEIVTKDLASESLRPEEMALMSRFLDRKGVQLVQTPDGEWINLFPGGNGSMIPMSTTEMSELVAKRTTQYPIGNEFSTALGDFESHGRQGGVWHPEDIKMQNMNLIKGNPDALASCLLDKGIFGTRPLIEKIQEVYFPDTDIDLKELVYQSSQNKETYDEMVDMFAGGLERIAFERYSAGKAVHDKENSGNLDAQAILDKYHKPNLPQEDSIA